MRLRAGQSGSAGGCVVAVAGRECCQRDPGCPPLRSLAQSLGLLLGELETAEGSDGACLLGVEGEHACPDLAQVGAGAEAAAPHSRIAAGDEHQLGAGWHVLGKEREDRATPPGRDEVYVVEHEQERFSFAEVCSQERKRDLVEPRRSP